MRKIMYQFYMPKKITSDLKSINKLINIYNKITDIEDDEITFNFSPTNWMSGELFALFGALTYNLYKKYGKKIFVAGISDDIHEVLKGNNFSNVIINMENGSTKKNSIKFTNFKKQLIQGNKNCFAEYLKEELSPKLELLGTEIEYIITNLSEIFINSRTHGNTTDIFCCGQKYPKISKIRLILVDLGVGIPFNVRNKIEKISDIECIRWAIEKGNTTKDLTKDTGGLGLNSVLNFVDQHNGNLSIISYCGQYSYKENIMKDSMNCFDGTIVYIDFDYTALKSIDILFKRIKKDNIEWSF